MSTTIKKVVLGANTERLQQAFKQFDYSPDELLAEYIDNSISASRPGLPVDIDITIRNGVMTYADNGTGITLANLENALTLGSYTQRHDGMHEHGLGFKQAMARMGQFIKLDSHTPTGEKFSLNGDLTSEFGLVYDQELEISSECELTTPGFQFQVKLSEIMEREFKEKEKLDILVDRLGAKYQDLLKQKKIAINLNIDNRFVSVKPVSPLYWNFKNNTATPLLEKTYKAEDGSWEAKVSLGYMPDATREATIYAAQKWASPKKADTYARAIERSGFDIKLGLRVIQHGAKYLSDSSRDLALLSTHQSENAVHGTIHLVKGFKTQSTKNRLAVTQSLSELHAAMRRDVKSLAVEIKKHEAGFRKKRKPVSIMADILANANVHKKRLNSFETVNPKLYEDTSIKHAVVDRTNRTLYVEPHKYDELNIKTVSELHLDTLKRIVNPNPLDLKKSITRIVTVVNDLPSKELAVFAMMLPKFTTDVAMANEIKQNELMTTCSLKTHMNESLGLST